MIQATRCSQKQLAYLAYWRARGYQFGRDDVIPESTSIPPRPADMPRPVEIVATLAAMILLGALQYFFN